MDPDRKYSAADSGAVRRAEIKKEKETGNQFMAGSRKKQNLVIVESPAKAHTIEKFLGGSTKVVASMGHIRDLPKSKMGINIEKDFDNSCYYCNSIYCVFDL